MAATIDTLFNAVLKDDVELTNGTINDYFGYSNICNPANLQIIYGIYSGLIKTKGVTKAMFENCFFTNRLDELIHTKSKYHKSGYYMQFCSNNITIGKTFIGESDIVPMPITDDDYCPSCEAHGYITENQYLSFMAPDCIKCGIYMCKLCVAITGDGGTCLKCH